MPDVRSRKRDATPSLPELDYWYRTSTVQVESTPLARALRLGQRGPRDGAFIHEAPVAASGGSCGAERDRDP